MAPIRTWTVDEPFTALSGTLLEGPHYSPTLNRLRIIDPFECKLHLIDLNRSPPDIKTINTGTPLGITADLHGNHSAIIASAKTGFITLDPNTGAQNLIARVWDNDAQEHRDRLTDGLPSPDGRFFFAGALNDPAVVGFQFRPEGCLFRLSSDGSVATILSHLTIPNGLGFSPDGRIMYLAESAVREILSFPYDAATGDVDVGRKRVVKAWAHDPERVEGSPDGMVVDAEGMLWVAMSGAGKVLRIGPASGEVVGEVVLPTRCVASLVFVGASLVVSTSRELQPERYPESARLGGRLFWLDVGVQGAEVRGFRLDA